jgi:hypothetical protein
MTGAAFHIFDEIAGPARRFLFVSRRKPPALATLRLQ